jgi:hypothetical protein
MFLNMTGFSASTVASLHEGCDLMTYFALCHVLYVRFQVFVAVVTQTTAVSSVLLGAV